MGDEALREHGGWDLEATRSLSIETVIAKGIRTEDQHHLLQCPKPKNKIKKNTWLVENNMSQDMLASRTATFRGLISYRD